MSSYKNNYNSESLPTNNSKKQNNCNYKTPYCYPKSSNNYDKSINNCTCYNDEPESINTDPVGPQGPIGETGPIPLTITPIDGGTNPISVHLTIIQVQ